MNTLNFANGIALSTLKQKRTVHCILKPVCEKLEMMLRFLPKRSAILLAQKVCLNCLATLAWVVRVCTKPCQAMATQALRRSSKSLQRWASTFTHNQLLAPKRIRARGEAVSKLKFWQRGRGARLTSDRSGV